MSLSRDTYETLAQQWVEKARSESDPFAPRPVFETLNDAATLAQAGHDDLAGDVLRAWSAAVTRRTGGVS